MPWYKSGTVSVTQNSNAVIGTGTAFIVNCRVGDAFRGPDGGWYEIINVASDTSLAIDPPYQGVSEAAGAYALAPMQGYVKDSADQLRAIVNTYGAQLAALGTTGNYDVLPLSKGGTGGTTQLEARTELGLGSVATDNVVPVARGGTGGTTQAEARTGLGLGSVSTDNVVPVVRGGTGGTTQAEARTGLGLGSVSTDNVVPVVRGGTGGTTQASARTALGLKSGAVADIVGTVSQSGGTPTGSIIESGSNANGEFTKFADGTMICRITGAAAVYQNHSNLLFLWTYPIPFVGATPFASVNLVGATLPISKSINAVSAYSRGLTSANCSILSQAAFVSGDAASASLDCLAIGRWFQ